MKILYVSTISNTINAFLIPHIKFLVKQGHSVDLACNIVVDIQEELLQLGCKVHIIEFQRKPLTKGNFFSYKKIKKLVIKENYELIHTHTPVASFLTRLACRNIKNVKIIYTAHGFHFFKGSEIKNWLLYYPIEKIAEKWTDGLITINQEDFESANKFNLRSEKSIYKIHGVGIDLEKFSPISKKEKKDLRLTYGYSEGDFILFYAAELNHNKNHNLLFKAVSDLKNRGIEVLLVLAGDGILFKEHNRKVFQYGITENVKFLGYRSDISNLVRLSDLVVASSKREGLPVNIMEAMATGLPLVVTDCRGHRDLISHGENGYILNKGNVKGFADSIEKLYHSAELRKTFGEKSTDIVKLYSIQNVIEELREVYSIYQ